MANMVLTDASGANERPEGNPKPAGRRRPDGIWEVKCGRFDGDLGSTGGLVASLPSLEANEAEH